MGDEHSQYPFDLSKFRKAVLAAKVKDNPYICITNCEAAEYKRIIINYYKKMK